MVLRKIAVYGFKSFADKMEIALDEGITAIVGPNGCGKSNVVDAIRWVFGEQKASMLRSSSMQDVIFSGTQKRQPLNFAEVTLVIGNNRGILPIEYSEVSITRRVFRTGESEYLLNRVPCRLRDIHAMFLDTGVGSNAYTTIENNMINSILSDKHEERRILFEEAAGIGKFKQRRKESLRKLEQTRLDLGRLGEKVRDKEKDVAILARQVEKARRYRKWYDELRALEIGFESKHYQELEKTVGQWSEELERLETTQESLRASIAAGESKIESLNVHVTEKENEVQEAGQEVGSVNEKIVALDKEISLSNETRKHLQENVGRFEEETESLQAQILEKSELRVAIEKGIVESESNLQKHKEELGGIQEELARFDKALAEKRSTTDALSTEHIRALNAIGDHKNVIGKLQTNMRNALDMRERSEKEIDIFSNRQEENNERLEECTRQLRTACEQYENLLSSRDVLVNRIEREDERYRELLSREKSLEAKVDTLQSRLEFLQSLSAQFEGYDAGVKALMTAELPGRIGIVADLINVSDDTMTAMVDRVLGNEIQTVVFGTNTEQASAISHLTENHVGSARTVSLERLNHLKAPQPVEALPGTTRLRDYVHTDEEHRILADHLFNRVLIAESLERAIEVSLSAGEGTIVGTAEGVICMPNGVVVAGKTQQEDQAGLLSRRQQIEQLPSQIEEFQGEYEQVVHQKERCIIQRDEAKVALAEVTEKLSAGQRMQQEQETHIKHYQHQSEVISEKLTELGQERQEALSKIEELQESIAKGQQELEGIQESVVRLEKEVEESKADVIQREQSRQEINQRVHTSELRIQGTSHKIQQNRSDIERLTKDIAYLENRIKQLVENRESTLSKIEELEARTASLVDQLDVQKDTRLELQSKLSLVREDYNRLLNNSEEIRKEVKVQREELERLSARVFQLKNEQTRADEKMRGMREKIFESYKVDLESPPEDVAVVEQSEEEVEETIRVYKERLNRLTGQVNMAAPEEYETRNGELQELIGQRDDLQNAVEDLEQAIRKLNKEARTKFMETFELVRRNFTEMFTTLFEGGEVHLALEENVDPLEAAIQINVRPAGKKMRGVQLLSGGERALTAISLLFALYKVKPSAYCILDELDAPLDDANVVRFVRILREFTANTQFIVITHNKRTMEAADTLYGVTQQEAGISTIVSVRLEEAMRHAA